MHVFDIDMTKVIFKNINLKRIEMKKIKKMSLHNLENGLSRREMRNIMAGSSGGGGGGKGSWAAQQAMLSSGSGGYPPAPQYAQSPNNPMGAGTNEANEQNDLLYFGQAISNGIQMVSSWFN